jgi:plastocyanin
MPASTRSLLALFMCAIAHAACGGSPAALKETAKFAVTLDDYLIRPQKLQVPSRDLTVTVTNRGRLGHTFRFRGKSRNVLAFTTLQPGETKTRSFRLKRGTYTMYCVLANHEELGMYGTLEVG